MTGVREADFYYGAVLSALFNKGYAPSLIENESDRQVYDVTTNDGNYRIFMKYRSRAREGENNYKSWQFLFDDDWRSIERDIQEGLNLHIILLCGCQELNKSEIAVLTGDEMLKIFDMKKYSITIGRKKHEHNFRISVGGGRDNAMRISTNRLLI